MCRSTGSPGGLPSTTARRSAGAAACERAESGFTLLEVLIAFAVLAVMLVPILQVFSGGLGMTQTARGYAEGVLLARSKLAELSVAQDLREGESAGEFDERGYRWRASVSADHSVVTLPDDSIVGAPTASGARRRRGTNASDDATAGTRSGSLFGRSSGSASVGSSGQSNSLFGRSGSSSSFGQSGSGSSFGQSGSLFGRSSSSGSGSSAFGGSRSTFGSAAGGTSKSGLSSSSGSSGSQGGASPSVDEDSARDQAESVPYRVAVTVEWGSAWSGGGAVTLSTLRLKQAREQGRNRPE